MKLVHYDFENSFDISVGKVNILVIEAEEYFRKYIYEMFRQIHGESGNFVLSDGEQILDLGKHAAVIESYACLSVDDRKTSSKLYDSLNKIIESDLFVEYQNLRGNILSFLTRLNAESDCSLSFDDESDAEGLFKAFNLHIEEEQSLLEKVLVYMRVRLVYFKINCFFFVNLKTVLSQKELLRLYHEAELMEVCLFLFENTFKAKLDSESVIIIDRDLCEILA